MVEMYQCSFPDFDDCIVVIWGNILVCRKYKVYSYLANYSPVVDEKNPFIVLILQLLLNLRLFRVSMIL